MIFLELYGANHDDSILRALVLALTRYGDVSIINKNKLIFYHNKSSKNLIYRPHIISIFKNSFDERKHTTRGWCESNFINLVDPKNKNAINYLKYKRNMSITCGMSVKDSMIISSLDYPKAIVSTQRTVKTVDSLLIEPGDLKIILTEHIGIYPILTTCAVLLVSGIPHDEGYII